MNLKLKYGDEVEYGLIKMDRDTRTPTLSLRASEVILLSCFRCIRHD